MAAALHPGGILVWEPAPPYQEGWPKGGGKENIVMRTSAAEIPWSGMKDQESTKQAHWWVQKLKLKLVPLVNEQRNVNIN